MDFLKSCTTNVRVVENLTSIPRAAFTLSNTGGNEAEKNSQLCKTIAKLRQGNILSTLDAKQLCVFGYKLDATKAALRELGYVEDAAVQAEGRTGRLLDAIEASLAYKLAGEGLVHVAPWTWLFNADDEGYGLGDGSTLIELHAKIGGNGALFISSTIRTAELVALPPRGEPKENMNCLLAPSGRLAKVHAKPSNADRLVVGNTAWKTSVSEVLQAEGVEPAEDEPWIEVELPHENEAARFLWPSRLCFRSSNPDNTTATAAEKDDEYWKKWFGPSIAQDDAFCNPLAAAEEWFTNSIHHQHQAALPADESAANAPSAPADTTSSDLDLVTSPPFNQRAADQQAAMGGIYPTPPDGLLPGTQGTQHLPASEGNTMPPINESSEPLPEDDMEGLRQSISSSNAPAGGFGRSDDDLFGDMGDMGGMDFGDGVGEVGDADFDYFDEPDEEPDHLDGGNGGVEDVDMVDGEPSHQAEEAEQAVHETIADDQADEPADADQDATQQTDTQDDQLAADNPAEDHPPATEFAIDPFTDLPKKSDRPLSPFGIRERLLPPPIPASTVRAENEKGGSLRRAIAFGPVIFNEGLGLAAKYSTDELAKVQSQKQDAMVISMTPNTKRNSRRKVSDDDGDSDGQSEDESSSEDGSEDVLDSETSVSEVELVHKMPWESRKRKRGGAEEQDLSWMNNFLPNDRGGAEVSAENLDALRTLLLHSPNSDGHGVADLARNGLDENKEPDDDDLLPIDQLFDELDDLDLVYIAQLIAEQSVSCIPSLVEAIKQNTSTTAAAAADEGIAAALTPLFESALSSILPATTPADIAKLALPREPPRPTPSASAAGGKGPHPVQRQASIQQQQGPDYCPIPAPHLRVQRYGETVELLPPALHFWSTLGLAPASGGKDLRVVSVVPGNLDLVGMVGEFVAELGIVYEACKLGSWKGVTGLGSSEEEGDELVLAEGNGSMVLVQPQMTAGDVVEVSDLLQSYALVCENLGRALAATATAHSEKDGSGDADRTIVVCIVNPFTSMRAQQALCACFWMLYKAYRDSAPKGQRAGARSDIVLRLLPVELLTGGDGEGMVILDQQQYAQLAMEIYDRCPPSSSFKTTSSTNPATRDVPASLSPFFAAPAIELSLPLPRRISFQLAPDPPQDLMSEGSVLHLAYAVSRDREWMCFSWVDGSGRFRGEVAVGLRGRSVRGVVEEGWERVVGVDAGWGGRVFVCGVVGDGGGAEGREGESAVRDCWRAVVARKPTRRAALHVSLLSVDLHPNLELYPPLPLPPAQGEKASTTGQGQGFLTPVTTPSGTSALTVSPDASAAAAATPLTPPAASGGEGEGEAVLVELADECWGVMLSNAYTSASTATPRNQQTAQVSSTASSASQRLASGLLVRRGSSSSSTSSPSALEAMQVNIHWDIRIRPTGAVDEGPARQAEFSLREVLRGFRGLGVLARARGIGGREGAGNGGGGVSPVHVGSVLRAGKALEGTMG